MKDRKTTIAGVLVIVATVAIQVANYLHGKPIDFSAILQAVSGLGIGGGLVVAADSKNQ